MPKRRPAVQTATRSPSASPAWERWSVQLPPALIVQLRVRAAQEDREIRDTLVDAVRAYVATPLPPQKAGS